MATADGLLIEEGSKRATGGVVPCRLYNLLALEKIIGNRISALIDISAVWFEGIKVMVKYRARLQRE